MARLGTTVPEVEALTNGDAIDVEVHERYGYPVVHNHVYIEMIYVYSGFRKAHRAGQKIISFAQIQLFHLFFPFCQSFQFPDHVLPLSKHFPCFTRISFL